MAEKKSESTEVTYSLNQIVFHFKFNSNTESYLRKKYDGQQLTMKEWENNFKKDGLKFSKP